MTTPLLVIAGYGPGLGISIADRFALSGFNVVGVSRNPPADLILPNSKRQVTYYPCDVTKMDAVSELVPIIERDHGAPNVLVYNAAQLLITPFERIESSDFKALWETNCLGAFHIARAFVPGMINEGGTLILTGATASIRGGARFAAFAASKFALRGLSQSLAREYGPKGIHIAHVIVDGLIWGPQSIARFDPAIDACLHPDDIAETYFALSAQKRSAWTHEIDLRPSSEIF